jgi:hypothetical protein
MNCDCKKDIEAKLVDFFTKQTPQATGMKVELQGYGFGISDAGMRISQYTEAKVTAAHPLKSGGTKIKTVKTSMHFSYCPFCGQKDGKAAP